MAHYLKIPNFADERGQLHVLEQIVPFEIKRVYYIHGVPNTTRGGHRHKNTDQVLVCVNGKCNIYNHNGQNEEQFELHSPSVALYVDRNDWHTMHSFSHDAVLLVLSSTPYDVNDYIDQPYEKA